jgi:predicted secreted protein
MVFFCLLPLGIENIDKPSGGAMPGAPVDPGIKRKAIIATAITVVFWVIAYILITSNLISFHDIAAKMRV